MAHCPNFFKLYFPLCTLIVLAYTRKWVSILFFTQCHVTYCHILKMRTLFMGPPIEYLQHTCEENS